MSVYKCTSFEEAEQAFGNFQPDKAYFKRVAELWDFADKFSPIQYPRGIFKFKTIEEANAHREQIELDHARK